jgi:hypothetical protein
MSIMVRGAFPVTTTRAGLKKVYFQTYSQLKEMYPSVFNINTSDRGFEDFVKISGLGRMSVIQENEPIPYDDAVEGTRTTVVHTMYGLGYQVSRVHYDDDQYGVMKRMTEALARSVRYEQEVQAWALFNDADAGATFTGFDGLPLIDDSHTLLKASSSTWDNRLTADLSASSLQAAVDMFATSVDDSNMNIALEPRLLVVPAQNRWVAAQLLESQYDPESADNAINPLADVGLSWFATPYITDTDSFFLLSDKSNHDLMFYWRLKPETDDTVDFDTKAMKFSVIQRFSICFNDPRGVVGSMGT